MYCWPVQLNTDWTDPIKTTSKWSEQYRIYRSGGLKINYKNENDVSFIVLSFWRAVQYYIYRP